MQAFLTIRDHVLVTDLWLFHLVNGWSGRWSLDWLVTFAERNNLFKGAAIMAAYWWLWFAHDPREVTRKKLLLALIGAVVSLVVARMLASALPFRVRPMYSGDVGYHAALLPPNAHPIELEDWSSFPSDQAALFFALAYGLWRCNRIVGTFALIFAATWVCLVRIYLGIHFPSDIATGAIIGIVCTYLTMRFASERAGALLLTFERHRPSWFYAGMFLITFEFASLFDDVRQFMHGTFSAMRAFGVQSVGLMGALVTGASVLATLSGAIALGFYCLKCWHSRTGGRSTESRFRNFET